MKPLRPNRSEAICSSVNGRMFPSCSILFRLTVLENIENQASHSSQETLIILNSVPFYHLISDQKGKTFFKVCVHLNVVILCWHESLQCARIFKQKNMWWLNFTYHAPFSKSFWKPTHVWYCERHWSHRIKLSLCIDKTLWNFVSKPSEKYFIKFYH